ncbi:MAG: SDR family oxidoreductase [Planctomycetota bacterium]|nr:SDR family oxidoreductase [Planctomycetota bacterium]
MDARQVVITGANRGLGLALARQCCARGDRVWAGVRRPDAAEALHALSPAGVLPLDMEDEASIAAFGATLAAQADTLDVLVNNAGANSTAFGGTREHSGVLELSAEHFMAQMRLNALGPMLLTRALVPLLRTGTSPAVVNISSQLGALALGRAHRRDIGYNASKAALNMITAATAGDLEADGIKAVTLHPGWVRTDMGGDEAPLTAEDSARGILAFVDSLGPEHSGGFYRWDGAQHPW